MHFFQEKNAHDAPPAAVPRSHGLCDTARTHDAPKDSQVIWSSLIILDHLVVGPSYPG